MPPVPYLLVTSCAKCFHLGAEWRQHTHNGKNRRFENIFLVCIKFPGQNLWKWHFVNGTKNICPLLWRSIYVLFWIFGNMLIKQREGKLGDLLIHGNLPPVIGWLCCVMWVCVCAEQRLKIAYMTSIVSLCLKYKRLHILICKRRFLLQCLQIFFK